MLENLNEKLLDTVIQIFTTKEEYEFIFTRLKREFKSDKNSS